MHEPSVLSVAVLADLLQYSLIYIVYIVYVWCYTSQVLVPVFTFTFYIKMTFLLILHRKNIKFEGLLQNFKNVALFEIVVQTGISIQKIFVFFF